MIRQLRDMNQPLRRPDWDIDKVASLDLPVSWKHIPNKHLPLIDLVSVNFEGSGITRCDEGGYYYISVKPPHEHSVEHVPIGLTCHRVYY